MPLLDATRHLVNAANIGLMRPGAVLLNFSREGVVSDSAVLDSFEAGHLGQYVGDFPGAVLHGHPQVVALPHLGASTREAEENCAVMVVDQLRDYLEHGNVANAVNFPSVSMPRESAFRVAIANANVPNMLGQISTAMAQAGLNIHNMVNKSRGGMAYTLVDVDSPVTPEVQAGIAAIHGRAGVIALPHLGASTREAEENSAVMVVDQLRDYLENGNVANAVNFPAVTMARESAFRVAIANANVPNMLGQISTAMANAGLNIHNMVNKSRGDMAYTLVDVDSPVTPAVQAGIAAIHGVLAVRYLPAA